MAVVTDVTSDEAIDALARAAVDTYGKLTIWVNNAGGSTARLPLTELTREQWDDCVALNQTAVWVGITTAARYMETGSIINISSGAGTGPGARQWSLRRSKGRRQLVDDDGIG